MIVEGILPVWKEAGYTSHDVVSISRKILNIKKIGHAGTLDPQVIGVLPLYIGRATRLIEYLQEIPKTYLATMIIGISSTTQDLTGDLTNKVSTFQLNEDDIRNAMYTFQGIIEQIPPMYSAVKVNGTRLYDLARKGIEIDRKSKTVTIYNIEVLKITKDDNQTEVLFNVECSKGTYIRTLCEDIGKKLGYPALMKSLVRTSTGNITENQCVHLDYVKSFPKLENLQKYVLPLDYGLDRFISLTLDEVQTQNILQGKKIVNNSFFFHPNQFIRIYTQNNVFIGIARWDQSSESLIAEKLFHPKTI